MGVNLVECLRFAWVFDCVSFATISGFLFNRLGLGWVLSGVRGCYEFVGLGFRGYAVALSFVYVCF